MLVGTAFSFERLLRSVIYSVQSAYPSGTEEILTIANAVYAIPAAIIAVKIIPLDLFTLNLKLNVSKEITSKPTSRA